MAAAAADAGADGAGADGASAFSSIRELWVLMPRQRFLEAIQYPFHAKFDQASKA